MGRIIGGFFVLVLGIGLLAGSFFTTRSSLAFRASSVRTEGTVVDFSEETKRDNGKTTTMYTPIVEFTASSGKTIRFNSDTSSSSPGYNRGDKVPVLYSEQTPERARLDSFMSNWGGPLIFGVLGSVSLLAGAGLFFGGLRHRKVQAWLQVNGMPIQAKLVGVEQNTSLKVNGRSPWRVCCQWQHPSTQKMYVFYSSNYWYDPTDMVKRDTLDAKVNPDNPNEYWLDTSFLPAKG
jgi:hypothetical protein